MKTTSFICLFLCIFLFQQIHAQQPVSVSVLRLVAPFKDSVHLRGYASCFVDSTSLMSLQSIQNQNFTPLSILTFAPKVGYSRYTYWLRFDLENLSQTDTLKRSFNLDVRLDSLTVFVTEHGLMKDSIRIGMFIRPHPQREKVDYPSNRTALIKLPPLAHFTVFAKIKSLHFDQDLDPVLFRTDKEANYFIWKWIPIYTWELCFLGILTFMALLTFGSYFQYRHRAYLFYGLYIVAHLIAYLCDFEHYEQFQLRLPVAWLNIYYRVPVYFSANIFYLLFTASFLESRRDYPQLHRFTQIFLALYLSFMVIERGLIFYDYIMATEITNFFAIFNGFVALIFLFYVMWIFRNKSLAYYLLAGSLCYVFGIIAAQLSISTNTMWNNGSLWNQLGILAELIFFWLGLAYKFRLDAIDKERYMLENQRLELERALSLANLRNQIAQDIHDEIGAGLTKISLAAQFTLRLPNLTMTDVREKIKRLETETRHLAAKLREIVFAINPEYDNFEDMQDYFRDAAQQFWAETDVKLVFDFPKRATQHTVAPDVKRHLLLIFTEMQNNVAKHAHATQVDLTLKMVSTTQYILSIKDNGCGFLSLSEESGQVRKNGFSKGLSGMKSRAESINADFYIVSEEGHGTTITVQGTF